MPQIVCDWRVAPVATLLASFCFIVLGIVGPLKIEDQINNNLEDEFLFVNYGQRGFDRWVDNLRPNMQQSYIKMHLFNVTNPVEAAAGTEPPNLVEVGPYVYRLWLVNLDPVFSYITHDGNLTDDTNGLLERVVTFSPWQYFEWDPDHPDNQGKSENDLLTVPWFAFWTTMANAPGPLKIQILGLAARAGVRAFLTKTVRELIWGYNDTFLMSLQSQGLNIDNTWINYIPNVTTADEARSKGRTTISCGFPNPARFQTYIIWENKTRLEMWPTEPIVSGSGGNFFGFYRRGKGATEPHFFTQLGRVLNLEYLYSHHYKNVEVGRYRFILQESMNETLWPPNADYNQLGYNGLFNATSFLPAPIYYSWPHFYLGDPWLYSHFSNMTAPNEENDESYFDIQQTIGATCHLSRKVQSNMIFGNVTAQTLQMNLTTTYYFPLWWMDVTADLSDEQASDMKSALDFYNRAVLMERVLLFGGAFGALSLFCISVYLFYKRRHYWGNNPFEALIYEEIDEEEGVNIGGYMQNVTARTPNSSFSASSSFSSSSFSSSSFSSSSFSSSKNGRRDGTT